MTVYILGRFFTYLNICMEEQFIKPNKIYKKVLGVLIVLSLLCTGWSEPILSVTRVLAEENETEQTVEPEGIEEEAQ